MEDKEMYVMMIIDECVCVCVQQCICVYCID